MKRFHLAMSFALLSVSGGAAIADNAPVTPPATTVPATTDTTTQTPPAASTPDPNETICKREKMTGSLIGDKVCMTRKEWDEQAADAKKETEHMQSGSKQQGSGGQ